MASPITHIVLAQKVLETILSKFDKKTFILGTSLPDIRYYQNSAKRSETHFDPANMPMVSSETDSFKAGMIFHSVVDLTRVNYMTKKGIYTKFALSDLD